jgi:hypothetical protein
MRKFSVIILSATFMCLCALVLPRTSAVLAEQNRAKTVLKSKFFQPDFALFPDDPEATFEGARVVHNVTVDGKKGMRIHAKFRVRYGYNVPCRIIAYFFDADGTPLEAADKKYSTDKGKVSASTIFTPKYDPAVYNDLQIFMPYEALNMEEGDEYNLKFYLALYDNDGKRFFGKSGWYPFRLTMP